MQSDVHSRANESAALTRPKSDLGRWARAELVLDALEDRIARFAVGHETLFA